MAKKKQKKKETVDRLEELVKLQQRSTDRWVRYATSTAKLATQRTVNPGQWMREYSSFSKGLVHDLADFIRLAVSSASR